MKKITVFFLTALVFCSMVCFPVSAESNVETKILSTSIETFEDGSYIVTTLCEEVESSISNSLSPCASTYSTKSGSKTETGYSSDGDVLWTFTLRGSFTYGSGTSSCTAATYSYTTPGSGWSLDSASTSKSGNTAYGTGEFVKKVLFITTDSRTSSLSISCSSTGTLS